MKTIITNDDFEIQQDEHEPNIHIINFIRYSENIINSVVKTRIILGATSTNNYKSLFFTATKVQTFKQFQNECKIIQGTSKISTIIAEKMTYTLALQLNYLIKSFSQTFIGYHPENLIVIDGSKFAYLSHLHLLDIDKEIVMITYPFSRTDFLMSPELNEINEIPAYIHYKVSYYSLASLIIYALTSEDDYFFKGITETKKDETKKDKYINECLDKLHIKGTKLYWLLKRSLVEEPKNRSIIFI